MTTQQAQAALIENVTDIGKCLARLNCDLEQYRQAPPKLPPEILIHQVQETQRLKGALQEIIAWRIS